MRFWDFNSTTKELADQVYKIIAPTIRSEIKSAVDTYRHHSIAGFWNIANDVAKRWIIVLGIFP